MSSHWQKAQLRIMNTVIADHFRLGMDGFDTESVEDSFLEADWVFIFP